MVKEYICRQDIEKFIEDGLNNPNKLEAFGYDAVEILSEIHYMPCVVEVNNSVGEWVSFWHFDRILRCNRCNCEFLRDKLEVMKFCPNCGTYMKNWEVFSSD